MDKPLHVQVAEALGWEGPFYKRPLGGVDGNPVLWFGTPPDPMPPWAVGPWTRMVPLFDTDWASTGRLIEKYGFWIRHLDGEVAEWDAFRNDDLPDPRGTGSTPLIAVCRLILRLAEAGKLDHGGK